MTLRKLFFLVAAAESLASAVVLLSIPSEGGISLSRLALLAVPLIIFGITLFFGLKPARDSVSTNFRPRTFLVIAAFFFSLTSGWALFLLRYLNPERLLPFYERLSPLLWLFLLLGIQTAIYFLYLQNGFHPDELISRKPVYRAALFAFVILFSVSIFVIVTKLGITEDPAYWGEPGVAILGWHFIIALLAGLVLAFCALRIKRNALRFIPFLIYIIASALWLSVPWNVLQNSFYAPITPPANIPFPYSDAGFYDYLSQSLLIGTKYLGSIPPRPLYVVFLSFLHLLFGQNYIAIIAAQTLVLALFPVSLYFLGKKLHSVSAGVIVALFAIFREYLGLWISSNTRVANSKIFTTDFPTAMGIAIVCLVFIRWLERRDLKSTIVAGGSFGLLLLFRTQSFLVLPVVFALAWFVYQRKTKQWIVAGLLFAFAMILTVAPWLAHNYSITGKIAFDDPAQMAIIYGQYSFSDYLNLDKFDINKVNLGNYLLRFTLENPRYVAGFITSHFLNTEIGGLLSLPLIKRYDGVFAPTNLYWVSWNGTIEWYNLLLLFIYLFVIAIGLGASWYKARWIGLVPLGMNLGYALANGISRFSSWRYNLPVDWVVYFYFAVGIAEIFMGVASVFATFEQSPFKRIEPPNESIPLSGGLLRHRLQRHLVLILFAFVLVGALPWAAKGFASPRYTSTREQLIARIVSLGYDEQAVKTFLAQPSAVIVEGRMLFPRMYRRDDGISSANPWESYRVQPFARIGFVLLNERYNAALFPTRDLLDFPQGADAIALACQREKYLETRLIVFPDSAYHTEPLLAPCEK